MDKVVDHLFVFRGNGEIQDFPGNYSDFRTYEDSAIAKRRTENASEAKPKNEWKGNNDKSRLSYNEQKEYQKLERDIAKLEIQKEELQNKFGTENWTGEEIDQQSINLKELIETIEIKTERWFELSAKLDE
jgi:ATP-binding cassette subfamily F protein uup